MDFKSRWTYIQVRESYAHLVINEAITNNSKYILVTRNHCLTCTLYNFSTSLSSQHQNKYIYYSAICCEIFPSLGFLIFRGKLFNTRGKAIGVELYRSAFPMWCSRKNVQRNYSVSSAWEAKLNKLCFQSVFDFSSFFPSPSTSILCSSP